MGGSSIVNDFPSFLSGAERENTQHILVKYMQREPPKGRAKKQEKPAVDRISPRSSISTVTYRGSLTARSGKSSPWAGRKAQSLKEQENEGEKDETRRNSLEAEILRELLVDEESPKSRKNSKKKKNKKGSDLNESGGLSNSYEGVRSKKKTSLRTENGHEEKGIGETRKGSPLKLNYTYAGELRLALEKLVEQDDDDTGPLTTSRMHNNNELSKSDSRLSFLKKMSEPEQESDAEDSWLPTELHIYLLNPNSPLVMLARSAWENYLIRETLEQDEEYLSRTKTLVETKKTDSEKFGLLYAHLKAELLLEENPLEEKFALINELKMGAERNFCLKKLFWRTSDILIYLIHQLQMYIPSSQSRLVPDNEDDKCQRADELEFCVLILETLAIMLRATEILPYRKSCMKAGQGKPLHDLVALLVCQPELPLCDTTKVDSIADQELEELSQEFNTAATALLSELILITKQSDIGAENEGLLTINWLIKIIEEQENMTDYVERVILSAMHMLSPASSEELLPAEAIKLFQHFSVLQMLIGNSASCRDYISENFYEEFKYYIQAPVILDKLPEHYPVSDAIVKLIEDVLSRILGKSVSLALNNILS